MIDYSYVRCYPYALSARLSIFSSVPSSYPTMAISKGDKSRKRNDEAHILYVSQWLVSKIEAVMKSEAGIVFSESSNTSLPTLSKSVVAATGQGN